MKDRNTNYLSEDKREQGIRKKYSTVKLNIKKVIFHQIGRLASYIMG